MTFCLAGLGNPGQEYAGSRHNAGRILLDTLVRVWNAVSAKKRDMCDLWKTERFGESLILAGPQTYMNENGPPLANLLSFLKIPPENLMVLHDEMDLPLGRIQLKRGGSSAGHRGVESLYRTLGTADFYRLRIGIGRPPAPRASGSAPPAPQVPASPTPAGSAAPRPQVPASPTPAGTGRDYVLSEFKPAESKILEDLFSKSIDGIDAWIKGDPARSTKLLNTRE